MLNRPQCNSTESLVLSESVARAQAGCAVAFDEVCEYFRPRLIRFLEVRYGTRADDAEDVTQEALTKAWQHLSRYRSSCKFSTWLYTIAHRTAIDHSRRRNRRLEQSGLKTDLEQPDLSGSSISIASVETRDESDHLWSLARQLLNEQQYAVLWLRYAEDQSIGEVAKVLGRSSVSIRVSLHRAKAILKAGASQKDGVVERKEGRIRESQSRCPPRTHRDREP